MAKAYGGCQQAEVDSKQPLVAFIQNAYIILEGEAKYHQ